MAHEPILIVDDNPINMKLTSYVLELDGYDVKTADSAASALSLMERFHPRLILMDLQMPGMIGFELTTRLKADPATRDILIVAVTAYAMKGDEQRARAAGCDGYVTKPIDTDELSRLVAHLIRSP